jgi:hypothetical protein
VDTSGDETIQWKMIEHDLLLLAGEVIAHRASRLMIRRFCIPCFCPASRPWQNAPSFSGSLPERIGSFCHLYLHWATN